MARIRTLMHRLFRLTPPQGPAIYRVKPGELDVFGKSGACHCSS